MKFRVFRVIILLVFGLIAFQLFQIQITNGDLYQTAARNNRFRLISEEGPRGIVYDRNGNILVRNTPSYAIAIVPAELPDDQAQKRALYTRLSELTKVPVSTKAEITRNNAGGLQAPAYASGDKGIEELVDEGKFNPFGYVIIKSKVERELANIVEELRVEMPGVYVLREPTRQYLLKENMAHLLGYTGGIPQAQLNDFQTRGYEINDHIGVSGIERVFEDDLRGTKGRRLVEVDASGREIRTLAAEPAQPGKNLVLTIDSYLQNAAVQALKAGMTKAKATKGALIAMNPNNGEILAMVSWPSYDDNLFANGISASDYAALIQNKDLPLFNRAISGEYPLGSVFKIVPASGALQEGVVDLNTTILDSGVIWVPNKFFPNEPRLAQPFYGWARQGLGLMNIISALAWSSDIYFYEVAGGFTPDGFQGLGLNRLTYYAQQFGFGQPTGIDIPGEAKGLVPTDRWKRLTYAQSWVTGDTYNMGIGQGFLLGTPLQLLNATAAVVNGGTLYKPQIARALIDADAHILKEFKPELIRQLPISAQNLAIVRQGLRAAVTSGTAQSINFAAVQVAGKTGSAEYPGPRDRLGRLPTHAWFTAFAPYENPQVALVVFVEGGGEGSATAVPIAGEFLKAFFHLPKDTPLAPQVEIGSAPPPVPSSFISESPQAGFIIPRKPANAPKVYKMRILGVENWDRPQATIVGWVRDRVGRPLPGVTLTVDNGGDAVAHLTSAGDGSFIYEIKKPSPGAEWHMRIEGVETAEVLTLKVQPSMKYTVLFYEE